MYQQSHNYVDGVLDEICLEGLDGITIEGLWTRLKLRPDFPLNIDKYSVNFLWKVIMCLKDVEMFELPNPRKPLVVFNRYDHVDPELGVVLEPKELPENYYPHSPVNDIQNGIRGSCATYKARTNITSDVRKLNLDEALQRWGNKLVFVGSQPAREIALLGTNVDPNIELTEFQYCMLERIGRSRYLGETTQGKVSLQIMGETVKSIFYHRKYLSRHKLITKQVHHMKTGYQNCSGSLLHIPRFFVERKPKAIYLTEKIIAILKSRPNNIAEYEEIRKAIGFPNALKKLCRTSEFQRCIKTDLKVPYRELYPNAAVEEWKQKGSDKEKRMRGLKLVSPDIDVRDLWTKEEEHEEETDHVPGILDNQKLLLDRSLMSQAIQVVDDAGPEGLSQMELGRTLGVTKLQSRTLCRNLVKKGVVTTYMNDAGRQRVSRFTSKKYDKEGKINVEFRREKERMMKLVGGNLATTEESTNAWDIKGKKYKENLENGENEGEPKESRKSGERAQNENRINEMRVEVSDSNPGEIKENYENENKENKTIVERAEREMGENKTDMEKNGNDCRQNIKEMLGKALLTNGKMVINVSREKLEKLNLVCSKEGPEKDPKSLNSILQVALEILQGSHRTHTDQLSKQESPLSTTSTCTSQVVNESNQSLTLNKENVNLPENKSKISIKSAAKRKRLQAKNLSSSLLARSKSSMAYARKIKRRAILRTNDLGPPAKRIKIIRKQILNRSSLFGRLPNSTDRFRNESVSRRKWSNTGSGTQRPRIVCKRPLEFELDEQEPEFKKPKPLLKDGPKQNKSALDGIHTEVFHIFKTTPDIKKTTTSFTAEVFNSPRRTSPPNVTYRLLRRANLIIESVRKHKVIHDFTKLMKYIKEEESIEGYMTKIDKKSLLRLLHRLSIDGHIKILKTVLRWDKKEKLMHFVCEPGITSGNHSNLTNFVLSWKTDSGTLLMMKATAFETCPNHTIIQSAIEQAKMKLFVPAKITKEFKEGKQVFSDPANTLDESKDETSTVGKSTPSYVYNQKVGRKYGFAPKFVRMQTIHHFLFYLVYCYEGINDLNQEITIKKLVTKGYNFAEVERGEMSKIYVPEVSWKMFVPPLPSHEGWPKGWAIMSDILLRLPLSIFVKLVNVSYIVPELEQYLEHPVKRYLLVRNLPSRLRNVLVIARRYIFTIHETVQRLCFIGLIQFGPQRLKEKDQVFVYVNHKATLLDTTTSKPGYHQISDGINYAEHKYEFRNLTDIETFWYELWNFCVHTELGGRMCVTGKDIVLEILPNKQSMIEAIHPKMPKEAALLDKGEIPGDRKGAAGLDSAIFAHLKRNWNWSNTPSPLNDPTKVTPTAVKPVVDQRKTHLANLKKQPLKLNEMYPNTDEVKKKTALEVARKKGNKAKESKLVKKKENESVVGKKPKKKNFVRHVMPRKNSKRSKPYYDEVDKKALQLMSKLRVEWSASEDNFLLLSKVAIMYLCPNPRRQVIGFQIIRDILHECHPNSKNKTSRACQRRILYMMKNPATAHSVALHLEDIRQDPKIIKQFDNVVEELRAKAENIEELEKLANETFRELITILQQKFSPEFLEDEIHELIPDSLTELRKQYDLVYPASSLKIRGSFQEVKNVVDIYCAVVNTIIHSSLCSTTDKTSYTYQLFQVYQQYPDTLLRSSMAKIRADQMVSLKKNYMCLKQKTGNYLPVSSSPYQLSISYLHILQTKYQHEIFHESYLTMKDLSLWYMNPVAPKGFEIALPNGGVAAALIELFTRGQLSFELDIPDQIIILDPRVSEKDKTYARIVQRYRELLQSCKSGSDANPTSILFKKPFTKLIGSKGEVSTENFERDIDDDLGDGDDDDGLEGIDDVCEEVPTSLSQQAAIARAASRIALYMMREELGDSMVAETQHAHDFFVVNSCKVFCKLHEATINYTKTHSASSNTIIKIANNKSAVLSNKTSTKSSSESRYLKQTNTIRHKVEAPVTNFFSKESTLQVKELGSSVSCENKLQKQSSLSETLKIQTDEDSCKKNGKGNAGEQGKNSFRTTDGNIKRKEDSPRDHSRRFFLSKEIPEKLRCIGINRIQEVLEEINSNLIVSEEPTSESQVQDIFMEAGASEADWRKTEDIMEFVFKKREIGATLKELRKGYKRPETAMSLAEILALLIKSHVMYRTGVVAVRYVHQAFMKPWLVHSYKLLRLDREKITPVPQLSAIGVKEISSEAIEPSSDKAQGKIRTWKRRKLLATKKDVERAVQNLDLSGSEKVHVAIRPWVKVDGSLNRRVLDRLLGSVLGFSMYSPGVSLKDIGNRFVPALQPFQARELVEILEKLDCVKLFAVKQSCRTTLFSKPSSVKIYPADGTEDESCIAVEPQADAVLKLGEFIGDKVYARDFLQV